MNKRLLELLNKINGQKATVKNLVDAGKLEEAKEAKAKLVELQDEFDILKDILDPVGDGSVGVTNGAQPVPGQGPADSTHAFANAARRGFQNATLTEGSDPDGGYTVPEDIQTRINEYRDAQFSLIDLVDVENVTTDSGARTFKKRSQQTGFTKVGEGAAITKTSSPQFERLTYKIDKYAGYFPCSNELLVDSDANITSVITKWIGDESRVTRNNLIIEALETKAVTAITGLDDIKKALNVTLGQTFKPTSRVITNDDGLQWLDTLKDSDGDYVLQPHPQDPMQMRLCAGATIVPLVVVPNKILPSDTATAKTRKIPFFIGDLKEAVMFWDRNKTTIRVSDIAAIGSINAFKDDLTIFRAIEREDVTIKDADAYVYAQYSMTDNSVAGGA